jgi:hypothetical protein
MEEGVDLAIRIGPLDESSMVARRICSLERVICALAVLPGTQHGTPRTPDDLQQHNCLWITSLPALRRWPFDTDDGIRVVPCRRQRRRQQCRDRAATRGGRASASRA